MVVKTVAKVLGILLLLAGIGSVVVGANALNGLFNARPEEIVMHFVTSGVLVVVGFTQSEKAALLTIAILGAIFLALGITYFARPDSMMAAASPLHELMRLVIGLSGLTTVIARAVQRRWRAVTA